MDVSRRQFLRAAGLATGAAAATGLLVACGGDSPAPQTPQGPSLQALGDGRLAAGGKQGQVFLAGEDFAIATPSYVGLGIVGAQGPIKAGDAQVWMVPNADPKAPVAPLGPFTAPWQGYANPQAGGPPGIHAADLTFDRAGVWSLLVELGTPQGPLIAGTQITVQAKPLNKAPGDKAIPSQTPTVDDNRGVDPICTRKPPCPLHEVTLAQALQSGKPVGFIFGTPAFCESRTCGPNLEELLTVRNQVGGRAIFIHAEVYKDDKEAVAKQIVSPTFKEWGFQSEPWIYLIDKTGTIEARYEGPVVATRIAKDLGRLLG